jgi:hypothetical protein
MPAFSPRITRCAVWFVEIVNRFAKKNANMLIEIFMLASGMLYMAYPQPRPKAANHFPRPSGNGLSC